MSLADDVELALPELRQQAESLMTEVFAVYEPGGTSVVDGLHVSGFTPKGSTFGKLQGGSASTKDPADRYIRIGGVDRPILFGGLHIPIDATVPVAGEPGTGWEYEVTQVGCNSDPSLLGRRYVVVSVPAKSYATARRLDVVEVTA